MSNFEKLASINVNERIEKKNGLSYLSWAWAVDQLLRADPMATWSYGPCTAFGDTLMVHCEVTAFEKPMTAHLPVMDHRNKAISNPDAFQVNTAMQRCLVKAIALHGLGLYIYAGEDLPAGEDEQKREPLVGMKDGPKITPVTGMFESLSIDMQNAVMDIVHRTESLFKRGDEAGAWDEWGASIRAISEEPHGDIARAVAWNRMDSKVRTALAKRVPKKEAA